jgi:hypothetical protein
MLLMLVLEHPINHHNVLNKLNISKGAMEIFDKI